MSDEFDLDASAVIPKFVHLLYDSDNGEIEDEDMFSDDCIPCEEDYNMRLDRQILVDRIKSLYTHMDDVVDDLVKFAIVEESEMEEQGEEQEDLPTGRGLGVTTGGNIPLEVTSDFVVEDPAGGFNKFLTVIEENGEEVLLRLSLLESTDGEEVKVGYVRSTK